MTSLQEDHHELQNLAQVKGISADKLKVFVNPFHQTLKINPTDFRFFA